MYDGDPIQAIMIFSMDTININPTLDFHPNKDIGSNLATPL